MASPSDVTGLIRRWRVDAVTGLAEGDPVPTVPDDIGDLDLVQATVAKQALLRLNALAGHAALQFDAVDDYYDSDSASNLDQPQTVVIIGKVGSGSGSLRQVHAGAVGSATHDIRWDPATGNLVMLGTGSVTTASGSSTVGAWSVITATWNGASSVLQVNGGTVNTGDMGTSFTRGTRIGANGGLTAGRYLNGHVVEVLRYNRALTPTERATVHSYVQDTYGITVADYTAGATGVTGSAASTVAAFTQAATGTVSAPTFTATAAQTLPGFTQTAAGTTSTPTTTGSAASTVAAFTQSAAGTTTTPTWTGEAASNVAAFSQAAAGTVTTPIADGVVITLLPAFTQAAQGTVSAPTFIAVAASQLAAFTTAAEGLVTLPAGWEPRNIVVAATVGERRYLATAGTRRYHVETP